MSDAIDPNRVLAVVAAVAREARPNVDTYVTLDSSLERELGLDSLARVELVLRLEREFSLSLPKTPPARGAGERNAPLEALKLLAVPAFAVLFVVTLMDATVHQAYFQLTSPWEP
jgi:acyl carrier protein